MERKKKKVLASCNSLRWMVQNVNIDTSKFTNRGDRKRETKERLIFTDVY